MPSGTASAEALVSSEELSTTISKSNPLTFDLGNLLCLDENPIAPRSTEDSLAANARVTAQGLINQLLTTCAIASTQAGVLLTLPPASTPLPREKPLPKEKEPTKWERFAAKKGISKNKRRDERHNLVYDEASGEWVPKWGYKGRNKKDEGEWLVEVDEKKEREQMERGVGAGVRSLGRKDRKERIKRNERAQRANERKVRRN